MWKKFFDKLIDKLFDFLSTTLELLVAIFNFVLQILLCIFMIPALPIISIIREAKKKPTTVKNEKENGNKKSSKHKGRAGKLD